MVELSLHEAIRTGDKDARLIYADWLEDNGRQEESALLRSGRWCLVPAGNFWMGGGGGEPGTEKVSLPYYFYLGTYPVTQSEWQNVMGSNPSHFSRAGDHKELVKSISDADLNLFPVENVSWDDVQVFLRKLNARSKGGARVYRLPSEAEWEYACRGAPSGQAECSHHYYLDNPSNDLSADQANFDGDYPVGKGPKGDNLMRTSKVGSYRPNRLGLCDMHGNVWEWTETRLGYGQVVRGGSWVNDGEVCRAALRFSRQAGRSYYNVGVRLALVPSPTNHLDADGTHTF